MKEAILLRNTGLEASLANREQYQGMIGSLMFLIVNTRPDITFATSIVSCFVKNPSRQYTKAVKTIMRYLKATRTVGITYGNGEGSGVLIIKSYSDSDCAGDHSTRKSTLDFIFMLNGGPVSWYSKRQATIALSLIKAEYIVLTLTVKEATWLRLQLTEIGLLDKNSQYTEIKVTKSTQTKQINNDLIGQKGEIPSLKMLTSITVLKAPVNPSTSLLLKGDKQKSITLVHKLVFHT